MRVYLQNKYLEVEFLDQRECTFYILTNIVKMFSISSGKNLYSQEPYARVKHVK